MSNNRDFKREQFKDRGIQKFQQNVYDKFRRNASNLATAINEIKKLISDLPGQGSYNTTSFTPGS